MQRILHANCFPPACLGVEALLTDEALVADAAAPGLDVIGAEERIESGLAHATSIAMTHAGFDWFRLDGEDRSIVAGISAGDLGGAEAIGSVLMPAARAVLSMTAALDGGIEPRVLVSVVPAGDGGYARAETPGADTALGSGRARRR